MNGTAMRFHAKFDAARAHRASSATRPCSWACRRSTRACSPSPALDREALREHAPVRLRLRAAAGRDPRGVRGAHRPPHPRALRHDRDRHAHLQPARGRAPRGHRRPAAAGRRGARRGRRGRGVRAGRHRPHPGARAPTCFPGYWRLPEKNKEEFTADGFFRTGDVGTFSKPTATSSIVGRSKDLIITGGYNVYPEGNRAGARRAARRARVRGGRRAAPGFRRGRHRRRGRRARRARRPEEAALIAALKARLANFKVPKRVHVVDDLPRNAMGKVQKNVLRRPLLEG